MPTLEHRPSIGGSEGASNFVAQGSQVVSLGDAAYNAPGNAQRVSDGAMNATSPNLTTASWVTFKAGMVVFVAGAGTIPATATTGAALRAHVISSSSAGGGTVVLDTNAITTCSGVQVDYGTPDNTAFTSAIAALTALGGGDLFIPPSKNGSWLIDIDAASTSGSNWVQGGGSGAKIFYAIGVPSNIRIRSAKGVTIRFPYNGTVTANQVAAFGVTPSQTHIEFDSVTVDGCAQATDAELGQFVVMIVDSVDDISFWNCRFHHLHNKTIYTYTGSSTTTPITRFLVVACHFYKNLGQAIGAINITGGTIARCYNHDQINFAGGGGAEAIIVTVCSHLTIDDFRSFNQGTAISLTNLDDHILIRGLDTDHVIVISGTSSDLSIEGCMIDLTLPGSPVSNASGIETSGSTSFTGVQIVGNTILTPASGVFGINMSASSTSSDLQIVGNTIHGPGGMIIGNSSGSALTGVTVNNNTSDGQISLRLGVVTASGNTINNGQLQIECTGASITGNNVSYNSNSNATVSLTGGSNTITGNVFTQLGNQQVINPSGAAATSNQVTGNQIIGGSSRAVIQEVSSAGGNTYTNNTMSSTGGTPLPSLGTGSIATANPGYNTLGSGDYGPVVVAVTQSATPAIDTDNMTTASITGLAQAITSMSSSLTGTPVDGQSLIIRLTDSGTGRAITWGGSFEASTVTLPTTTVASTILIVGFIWNTVTSKWRCVGVA